MGDAYHECERLSIMAKGFGAALILIGSGLLVFRAYGILTTWRSSFQGPGGGYYYGDDAFIQAALGALLAVGGMLLYRSKKST